jgi:hypothetical protein
VTSGLVRVGLSTPGFRRRRRILAFALALLLFPGLVFSQPAQLWFGVWKVNVERSSYSSGTPPYKRATRRIEPSERGVRIVDDVVQPRGGVVHLEWIGRFDGLDYPVQGAEVVLTNAYRCHDDRTCELVQKLDGEVVVTARLTISRDGRVLTTVAAGQPASFTTIYEKQ